eukprot:748041-Hanusia_phi.AAC.1
MVPSAGCVPGVDACCPNQSPFSCGGPARMAIIHGFIRKLGKSAGSTKSNTILAKAMQEGVRAKIAEYNALFTNPNNYGCQCSGGGTRVDCCS